MLLKKATVVMVESDDAPIKVKIKDEDVLSFPKGALVFNADINPSIKLVGTDEIVTPEMGYERIYLHAVIKTDLNLNDLYLNEEFLVDVVTKDGLEGLKVISSSDRRLNIPKFSKGFLAKYIETQGIFTVFVVFEDNENGVIKPKVNRNNVISLRKNRDSFSRLEVIKFLEIMKENPDKDIDQILNF